MVISVLVEISFNNKEKTFDYLVSKDLEDKIEIGKRVLVPFGKQSLEGFIIDIKKNSEYDLKEITSIIDEEPILNEELLNLGKELKKDLVCNLISIYQAMLPSGYKASAKTNINVKKEKYVKLANIKEAQEFITTSKAQKQIEVVEDLLKNKISLKSKYQSNIIKVLKDKSLVIEEEKEKYRLDNSYKIEPLLKLNEYQEEAINQIENSKKDVILLNGVTGSGKTEIYMHLINKQISLGKTAIMLVPEISLTPQIINRFKVHFGNKIAVFHSALSESEKYDEYRKIRRGEVSIVIGARSAIFTPLKNIGIIIIDEEHSSTYKQEHNPRYNAIDVAIIRGKYHNAKVVLGSATPQIESYARGKKGYYELVSLTKRANNACLPNVTIVDMKNEVKKGNSLFSEILIEKMREKLENNEQVILFLNRRGFSSYQLCSSCGEVIKCPNCDITLTYHKTSGMNRCHYCGYAEKKKDICPKCKNESLKDFGQGTEKVEEEIKKIFQSYRTVRMDIDTTTKKGAHEKIINSFLNHEYDILVGTQMIAKGLDFPLVSLVGVINADTILNFPDFRSSERTYQMLSQVSGRAGRGNIKGDVIIQTFNPDNYSIELSKTHNYVDFFNKEIKIRKDLKYPPYYFISLIKIGGKDYNLSLSESKKIANYIKENISEDMIVLGPSVSGVSRVNKIYYFQIIIKFRNKEKMREILNNVSDLENNNKVSISIDINPC